jgi:hypothetical protein
MVSPGRPWWSRIGDLFLSLGLRLQPEISIAIPGRRTGKARNAPVTIVTLGDRSYAVGNTVNANWVRDARAVGWGLLTTGRTTSLVRLHEVPERDRLPVLMRYQRHLPHNGQAFQLPREPDAWSSVAAWFPVFELDRSPVGAPSAARAVETRLVPAGAGD